MQCLEPSHPNDCYRLPAGYLLPCLVCRYSYLLHYSHIGVSGTAWKYHYLRECRYAVSAGKRFHFNLVLSLYWSFLDLFELSVLLIVFLGSSLAMHYTLHTFEADRVNKDFNFSTFLAISNDSFKAIYELPNLLIFPPKSFCTVKKAQHVFNTSA